MKCKRNKWDCEEKREEVVDVFREGRLELLAGMEMNLKGNGEVSLCGVNGYIADGKN